MLALPHTPHALVARKLRRGACQSVPDRSVTSAMLPMLSCASSSWSAWPHCSPEQMRIAAMSAALSTMPSVSRNPAARSTSSPGVRMVSVTAWPPILIPSGSSPASRSARSLTCPASSAIRVIRRRAVRPVTRRLPDCLIPKSLSVSA